MSYNNLIVTDEERIRVIEFNRPKALNALNAETLSELSAVLEATSASSEIGVVILTGAGKAFVAGADITEMQGITPEQAVALSERGQRVFDQIEALPQPVIAAVNGFALGGGTELALACDFIYASEKAVFGLPEVKLGLMPGFGGTQRLARKIPVGAAREIVYTGEFLKAEEAYRVGLATRMFAPEALMEGAKKTAQTILKRSHHAVAAAKRSMVQGVDLELLQGQGIEASQFGDLFNTDHPAEGTSAFLEKRNPDFSR